MGPQFFCDIELEYSEQCTIVFCLARLPFSWSFSSEEWAFLRVLFVFVPVGFSSTQSGLYVANIPGDSLLCQSILAPFRVFFCLLYI